MSLEDVDLLLVCVLAQVIVVGCLLLLRLALLHLCEHYYDVLLLMVYLRVVLGVMNRVHVPDGASTVGFGGYALLEDPLSFLFVAVQVFELALQFAHDQQFLRVLLHLEGVGRVVGEVFSADFAEAQRREPTQVLVVCHV